MNARWKEKSISKDGTKNTFYKKIKHSCILVFKLQHKIGKANYNTWKWQLEFGIG